MRPDLSMIDPWVLGILAGTMLLFGILAALALAWAVGDGQLENLGRSSRCIFDPDEPEGRPTDSFPERD